MACYTRGVLMPSEPLNLWVLANPSAPHLSVLQKLPPSVKVTIGQVREDFANAPDPQVLLNTLGHGRVLDGIWDLTSSVVWFHSLSAGVEGMLIPQLKASQVPLTNSRGVYKRSLAEYALAAALFFAKDLRRMLRQQAAHQWVQFPVEEVHGRTMGIVGYGEIGKACARRAHEMGMKVAALRRRPEKSADDPYVDRVLPNEKLHELLAQADYVVLCAPHTPATVGMIGGAELAQMKPNAVLISIGRGSILDEAALVQVLRERKIRGAALDVFAEEPLPAGHPFYDLDNVLLSPHCADQTATWLLEAMEFFVENFQRFEKGEPLQNIVDKEAGY